MAETLIDELTEDHPMAEQPPGTLIPLKTHQLTLLHRCQMYERDGIQMHDAFPSLKRVVAYGDTLRTRIGIIGDRAGSGKSFVVLALICQGHAAQVSMPTIRTYGMNTVHISISDKSTLVRANLLVVPHNLVSQWEAYISSFCPTLNTLVIKSSRHLQQCYDADPNQYDVFLVTSTYCNAVIQFANARSYKFTRSFFDEIDNMNIPGCVKPDAAFTWFVTASYNNLINPRGCGRWNSRLNKHIWSTTGIRCMGFVKTLFLDITYSMSPAMIKTLIVKNRDAFVVRSMSLSPVACTIIKCRTPKTINLLSGLADKMIISYLNAGDIMSALHLINPTNKDTEENIVLALIDKYNRALHALDARRAYTESMQSMQDQDQDLSQGRSFESTAELTRIKKKQTELQDTIQCIRQRITSTNTCCICYEDIANKSIVPCCSNSYCLKCISTWLSQKKECPMCKSAVQILDLLVVQRGCTEDWSQAPSAKDDEDATPSENYSKAKNLEILLKRRKRNDKILIFSSYDRALVNVSNVLETNNVRYSYLKGNQHQIAATLASYHESALDVLLVNPSNYGCGTNLTNTTDIIMLHKFDTEIERQVIGRAHRVGRKSELRVWYLLYENECP